MSVHIHSHLLLGILCAATYALPVAAQAASMVRVRTGVPYDLRTPPAPVPGTADDLFYRWVPLCEDGSGDHEWSTPGGDPGVAPTCQPAHFIRCIDGTRPMYYVDRARSPVNGAYISTDRWVFWFQGGGSCSASTSVAGEECWGLYNDPAEADEMSTLQRTTSIEARGILDPDRGDNVFKTYNRVRIAKCSYDRFMGISEMRDVPNGAGALIDLFWHGRRMIEAVVSDLEDGATFKDQEVDRTMPPLRDATRVLFAGHSGGSGGVIMNGDWMAELVRSIQPGADVRLLVDARFRPGIEDEASFDPGWTMPVNDTNSDGQIDLWDHMWPTEDAPGELPDGSAYHDAVYEPTGAVAIQQDQWGAPLDESCQAAFGAGAPYCREELHVLLNHVETPFFLRQALRDGNHIGSVVAHADDLGFRYGVAEFKERVIHQIRRFVDGHATLSMAATGKAGLPAPSWPYGVFAPDVAVHVGNSDDDQFFDVELCEVGAAPADAFSYHDALADWITHDIEVVAVDDGIAYCNAADPGCSCH